MDDECIMTSMLKVLWLFKSPLAGGGAYGGGRIYTSWSVVLNNDECSSRSRDVLQLVNNLADVDLDVFKTGW